MRLFLVLLNYFRFFVNREWVYVKQKLSEKSYLVGLFLFESLKVVSRCRALGGRGANA